MGRGSEGARSNQIFKMEPSPLIQKQLGIYGALDAIRGQNASMFFRLLISHNSTLSQLLPRQKLSRTTRIYTSEV
jgi:hypothetical protein